MALKQFGMLMCVSGFVWTQRHRKGARHNFQVETCSWRIPRPCSNGTRRANWHRLSDGMKGDGIPEGSRLKAVLLSLLSSDVDGSSPSSKISDSRLQQCSAAENRRHPFHATCLHAVHLHLHAARDTIVQQSQGCVG